MNSENSDFNATSRGSLSASRNDPYVLIMAGGIGSRFWPASRENKPKQFLDITGSGTSLIRMTFERFAAFIPAENIYVITNESYSDQTLEAIPALSASNLICEPSRNNTAACIAFSSMKLIKKNREAVCIVAPADHLINKEEEFQRVVHAGVKHAFNHKSIITLGITPTRVDTGYGYIEYEKDTGPIHKVISFREKPEAAKAEEYIKAGNFAWNSGIFIWRLDSILDSFKQHSSQIYNILAAGEELFETDDESAFIKSQYPLTENISVDYAIMEKAENVFTIPCDIGWSDLGTWNSLYQESEKDQHQNALLGKTIYIEDTTNSIVMSKPGKLIAIKGLENFIVVDADDCLLIYPRDEEQNIKGLKEELMKRGFDDYL